MQRFSDRVLGMLGHIVHRLGAGAASGASRHLRSMQPAPSHSSRHHAALGAQAGGAGAPSSSSRPDVPPAAAARGQPARRSMARAAGGAASAGAAAPPGKQEPDPDPDGMWMVVGLGNPGPTYDRTRHNVGFMVVDALARSEGIDMRKLEKGAAVGRGMVAGRRALLVKPITFMNNSGEAVAALAKFYKVPTARILVISDDLDQPTAVVRLKQRGGHGGHNGLRSIIQRLGNCQDFPRLKIGIGRPSGQLPVSSYVLQPFSKAEQAEVDGAVAEALAVVVSVLRLGLGRALSGVRA